MTRITFFRWSLFGGLFLVLLTPLVVSNSLFFPFVTGKVFFFRIVVEIIFAAWLVLCLFDAEVRPRISPILAIFVAFVGVILLADIFGVYSPKSLWSNFERMEGFVTMLHLLLYFVVLGSVARSRLWWKIYFSGTAVVAMIVSFHGLLQLAGSAEIHQGGARLDASIGNAAYLGSFMLFQLFILGILLWMSRRPWEYWTWGTLAVLEFIILYNTQTRGAILGLIVGALITLILVALFGKEYPRLRRYSSLAILGLLIIVGLFISLRNTSFIRENATLSRFADITPKNMTTQARYYVWPIAVEGFLERPLLGWGQENFSYVFNARYNPALYNQEQWFDRAHNAVLDWLVATGIFGATLFLALFIVALWLLWRKKSEFSIMEKSILAGLIGAYFFQAMFVFDNLTSYIMLVIIFAYIHSMSHVSKNTLGVSIPKPYALGASAVIFGIVLYTVYAVNIPGIQTAGLLVKGLRYHSGATSTQKTSDQQAYEEIAYQSLTDALSQNTFGAREVREQLSIITPQVVSLSGVSNDLKSKFVSLTKEEFEKQFAEKPGDARYYALYASFLRQIGDYNGAVAGFSKALEFSPNKQSILLGLGLSQSLAGDNNGALESFKTAFDLTPQYIDARTLYAYGMVKVGDEKKAEDLLLGLTLDERATDSRTLGIFVDMKKYDEVVAIWKRRIELEQGSGKTDPQSYFSLAAAYLYLNDADKAVFVLSEIAAKVPGVAAEANRYIQDIKSGTLTAKDLK